MNFIAELYRAHFQMAKLKMAKKTHFCWNIVVINSSFTQLLFKSPFFHGKMLAKRYSDLPWLSTTHKLLLDEQQSTIFVIFSMANNTLRSVIACVSYVCANHTQTPPNKFATAMKYLTCIFSFWLERFFIFFCIHFPYLT